jgi:uncharacterized protein (TIGR03083 family)
MPMPPRHRRTRTYDPARTRAALLAQARGVLDAVGGLEPSAYGLPTRLGDWTVRELVAHLAGEVEAMSRVLGEEPAAPPADLTPGRWALATAPRAGRLDEDTRRIAAGGDPAARLAAAVGALEADLAGPLPDLLVRVLPGTLTAADFAVTRLVELVVHADDLAAATGVPVPQDRRALAAVVRVLADAFADKAPGNAVELRVPPFAAVQCVAGPRHTRGTPPNVVETDPLTWIRLACGRLPWADALAGARVSASGERADLAPYLPVLG